MLYVLFIVTTIFVVCAAVFRTGRKFNPLTFYITFWGIWTIVSLGNHFLLYTVSTGTYLIVFLHIIFSSLGFLLINPGRPKNIEGSYEVTGYDFLHKRKYLAIQIITCIILIYFYRKYNILLNNLGAADSRRIVYEQGLLFSSAYFTILFSWIVTPIVKISVLFSITNLILNGKKNLATWVSMVNCVLFSFIGGGRFIFFELISFILISFGFKYDMFKMVTVNFKKMKRVNKLFYAAVIVFGVYFMNLNTAKRLGITSPSFAESWELFKNTSFKQFVLYFTGPFRALDYFLTAHLVDSTGYTFGRSFLSGLEEMFNTFLVVFSRNGFSLNTANTASATFTVQPIVIGNGMTFNAFYTCIMNFYLDGGIPLVIVLSALLGAVMAIAYRYFMMNRSLLTFSLLVFMTYQMVATEFRWNYSAPGTCLVVMAIVYLQRRRIKKANINEDDILSAPTRITVNRLGRAE